MVVLSIIGGLFGLMVVPIVAVGGQVAAWAMRGGPPTGKGECWNHCWNMTLKAGENPASFLAGRQQFLSQVPSSQTFSLAPGVQYLLEVWDSKGRVERHLFTL